MTNPVDMNPTTLDDAMWRGRNGGHDIDVLVAEHVYGWRKVRPDRRTAHPINATCTAFALEWEHERRYGDETMVDNIGCACHWTPRFSTDPAASKELAAFLRKAGWLLVVKHMPDGLSYVLGNDAATDPKVMDPYCAELSYYGHRAKPILDWTPKDFAARFLRVAAFSKDSAEMAVAAAALEAARLVKGLALEVR